jgi:hypothetical protein
MDCKTARLLAELRGDRAAELPAEDNISLDQHLLNCADCQRLRLVEERFDAPIARAMRAVAVPPALKGRILNRLATQRGAVYRKRLFYAAAAAAAVVIAVGVVTWRPHPAPLNLYELVHSLENQSDNPRGEIDMWLAKHEIHSQPPVKFDPRLLAFHGMKTIQDKQVPTLEYRVGDLKATVYLIRDSDFDLSSLPNATDGSGSSVEGYHIEIFRDRDQPNKLAYVIVFKNSLEAFLIKPGPAA